MTVQKFMRETASEATAITFIIRCLGEMESFTKKELDKLNRIWGLEEVENYYMMNTREMVINIK